MHKYYIDVQTDVFICLLLACVWMFMNGSLKPGLVIVTALFYKLVSD